MAGLLEEDSDSLLRQILLLRPPDFHGANSWEGEFWQGQFFDACPKCPIKEPLKGCHVTLCFTISNHRTSRRVIRLYRHCRNICMDRTRAVRDFPRALCDFPAIQGSTAGLVNIRRFI